MKFKGLKVATCLLAGTMLMTSCVGSFSLFNKLASWNKTATSSKFLNELIFILISPAYAVCSLADVLVLNTIEFWSGSNPVANNIGKTQKVKGADGVIYAVKTLKDGYEVTSPEGKKSYFHHDDATDTWSYIVDGVEKKLIKFNGDGTINAYLDNGHEMTINQDAQGLQEVREAVATNVFWAQR